MVIFVEPLRKKIKMLFKKKPKTNTISASEQLAKQRQAISRTNKKKEKYIKDILPDVIQEINQELDRAARNSFVNFIIYGLEEYKPYLRVPLYRAIREHYELFEYNVEFWALCSCIVIDWGEQDKTE